MLKISPTNNPEYFEKLPPLDNMTRPIAILKEAKTEITVSVDTVFLLLILFRNSANIIPNIKIVILVSIIPNNVPIATPVRAECPRASEKNAILLLTIIVPRIPNNGVIISIASNAFFIKSYCIQGKGSITSIILYKVFIHTPI
jgi:hypothetical protein